MHVIALGKTRSGKSSKLRVLTEHQLEQGAPVIIIDPKGDWWGLKSSADGRKSGYPLVIFGGEHADVPINSHSGAHIAELLATGNRSALIDLGGWTIGDRTRFFIDFAAALFKLHRGERHLVIDEVHNFCPKGKVFSPEAGMMLHWANRLASEGQGKGIILLAASQRPQKVHNDFLTSCETLIAAKVIHKADRDAIKDWIDGCADPAVGKEVLAGLAQLKKPEAWVWSPEVDFGPKLVTWPLFQTYDSFKPQPRDAGKLKGWAEVDLEDVKAKLETVVQDAAANDPKALKARIRDLEAARAKDPQWDRGEVLEAGHRQGFKEGSDIGYRNGYNAGRQDAATLANEHVDKFVESLKQAMLMKVNPPVPVDTRVINRIPPAAPKSKKLVNVVKPLSSKPLRGDVPIDREAESRVNIETRRAPGGMALKILSVLSQYPEGCTAGKLTLLTGLKYTGSFRTALSELRTGGFLEGDNGGTMRMTAAGEALGPFPQLPQGEALLHYWLSNTKLGGMARKILAELRHGDELTADELCERTGLQYTGSFRTALSELRTAGVLVGKNSEAMRISPEIVPLC